MPLWSYWMRTVCDWPSAYALRSIDWLTQSVSAGSAMVESVCTVAPSTMNLTSLTPPPWRAFMRQKFRCRFVPVNTTDCSACIVSGAPPP